MATRSLPGGIVVGYPDGLGLRDSAGDETDGLRASPEEISADGDEVLKFVASAPELTTVVVLEISGGVEEGRLAAMEEEDSDEEVTVRLPLGDDEAAVLLSESDGVLRWEYPESIEETAAAEGDGGLGVERKAQRVAVFRSRYGPVVDKDRAPERLGFAGDFLLKPIKKLVLRFTARKTAEAVGSYLERDVSEGPIVFRKGADGSVTRTTAASFSEAWPAPGTGETGGARTILLFVHGTFSSTEGSFGGLATTTEGAAFLSGALDRYDAVIGYDHKTLTKNVARNATDLRNALDTLPAGEVTIDAVAFSRGGLVLRYLTEVMLPKHSRTFRLRNAVFVGCTNGGTELGDPNNWKALLDLYTNLVSGAGRVVGFLGGPPAGMASGIISGALRGALSFVRYLATETATGEAVPGLASMNPEGPDVRRINQKQPGQPEPSQVDYYVIEGDFDHSLFGENGLAELGLKKRLFLEFADNFIDQLFQNVENDLVVDRASMSHIDPWATEAWIQGRHRFAKDDGVYHTVYFNNSLVAEKLKSWLL